MFYVTAFYAAILGLMYLLLSVRAIQARRSAQVSLGDGNNPELIRRMRAHGNFSEYVPIGLLLAAFLESLSPHWLLVHFVCLTLLVGRAVHAYGVSQSNEVFIYRMTGMALTFTSIATSALAILALSIIRWFT